MSFEKGDYAILYIKLDTQTEYLPIGCLSSNSISENTSSLPTTVRTNGGGWTTSIPTTQSYNLSLSGFIPIDYDNTTLATYKELTRIKRLRIIFDWKVKITENPTDDIVGKAYINSISWDAPANGLQTFGCEMTGFGSYGNQSDFIFDEYNERVRDNNGELTSEECTLSYINELLKEL